MTRNDYTSGPKSHRGCLLLDDDSDIIIHRYNILWHDNQDEHALLYVVKMRFHCSDFASTTSASRTISFRFFFRTHNETRVYRDPLRVLRTYLPIIIIILYGIIYAMSLDRSCIWGTWYIIYNIVDYCAKNIIIPPLRSYDRDLGTYCILL